MPVIWGDNLSLIWGSTYLERDFIKIYFSNKLADLWTLDSTKYLIKYISMSLKKK